MVYTPQPDSSLSRGALTLGFGRRVLGVGLVIALSGAALVYLIQTNAVATKGYEIKELERQVRELQATTHKREVEATEKQSLSILPQALPESTYVAVERIEYLTGVPLGSGVAVR